MRKFLIFLSALLIILLGLWATVVFMLDEARLKALAIEQVEQRTGRTLQLNGPLELKLFPRIELVAREVTLEGPPGFDGPALFTADAFRMSVALWPLIRGEVETGAITLDDAEIRLHTDRAGRSTLDGLQAAAATSGQETAGADRPEVSIEGVRLNNVRLVVSDARTSALQRFLLERFELDTFRFDADVPFVFRGEVGDPPTLGDIELTGTVRVPAGNGPIVFGGLELSARSGELTLGLDGTVQVDTGRVTTARLEGGRVEIGGQALEVSATWRGTPRPSVTAEVRGQGLDVDALLATLPAGDEAADASESPLLVLRDLDADAQLTLDRMQIGGLPLQDVRATLAARGGIVTLDPLAARLDGGSVRSSARLDLNAEPPRVEIRPIFELDSLSTALAPWGLDRYLAGAGLLELSLNGRGLTPAALLESLDGQGRYDFRDGAIQGLDLDGMVDALVARDVAAAVRNGVGGRTSFREFTGPLAIERGVVDLSGLTLLTERLGVSGSIQLGLADLSLGGELRLAGERLQRVPLRLGGSLTAPQLTPDVAAAVRDEAGRRVLDLLQRTLEEREDEEDEEDDGGGDGNGGD